MTREFTEITLWFKTDRNLSETDAVYFDLPSEFVGAEGCHAYSVVVPHLHGRDCESVKT